jgi:hypothetical protein
MVICLDNNKTITKHKRFNFIFLQQQLGKFAIETREKKLRSSNENYYCTYTLEFIIIIEIFVLYSNIKKEEQKE